MGPNGLMRAAGARPNITVPSASRTSTATGATTATNATIHAAGPACAPLERCNGRDDDCDDMIDEGCDPGTTTADTGDVTDSSQEGTTGTDMTDTAGMTGTADTSGAASGDADDGAPTSAGVDTPPGSATAAAGDAEDAVEPASCDCVAHRRPDVVLMLALLAFIRRRRGVVS